LIPPLKPRHHPSLIPPLSAIETKDTKGGGREESRKQLKRMLLKSFAFFLAGILPVNLKIYTKEKKRQSTDLETEKIICTYYP